MASEQERLEAIRVHRLIANNLRVNYQRLTDETDRLRLQVATLERERVLLTRRVAALSETVPGQMWPELPPDAEIQIPRKVTAVPKRLDTCEACGTPTFGTRCGEHLRHKKTANGTWQLDTAPDTPRKAPDDALKGKPDAERG